MRTKRRVHIDRFTGRGDIPRGHRVGKTVGSRRGGTTDRQQSSNITTVATDIHRFRLVHGRVATAPITNDTDTSTIATPATFNLA